jgi:uncharacterized protein (DUF1501 family)
MINYLSRRHFLQSGATLASLSAFASFIPRTASAAGGRDPRLMVIVLRGGLDGLTAAPPIGDPGYTALHQGIALTTQTTLPLDGFFALHPAMPNFARLYKSGQATVIHASATAYRDRSHFDGQDVLESGFAMPGHTQSGWLNRAFATIPFGQRVLPVKGLSVGTNTPLVIRGAGDVLGWAPAALGLKDADLPTRLLELYQIADPKLAKIMTDAIATGRIAGGYTNNMARGGPGDPKIMVAMAAGAAHLMAQDDGPRIGAMAFEGWDTHVSEKERLNLLLSGLDNAFAAIETGMGPLWNQTAVLVITEFGRTAAVNGTQGTDHGTATTAFLAGGRIKGGKVIADWPGLKPAQLYQGRDLAPTTDQRAVIKGLLSGLYDISSSTLATTVFPDSQEIAPITGLVA